MNGNSLIRRDTSTNNTDGNGIEENDIESGQNRLTAAEVQTINFERDTITEIDRLQKEQVGLGFGCCCCCWLFVLVGVVE